MASTLQQWAGRAAACEEMFEALVAVHAWRNTSPQCRGDFPDTLVNLALQKARDNATDRRTA